MKFAGIAALLLSMVAISQSQTTREQTIDQKPGRRLALLIGNRGYTKLHPLEAVPKELELVRTALEKAGFQITPVKDVNYDDLTKALDSFVASVQPGDICFVYYSGYAAQDGDDDYLIPTDFDPSPAPIDSNRAYPLTVLAKNLEVHKAGLKMFFIEGARKFDARITNVRPGLRIPFTSDLTEVLFAIPNVVDRYIDTPLEQPGSFTVALAQMMERVDDPPQLPALMQQVRKTVIDEGKGQQPTYDNSTVTQVFYFHAPKVFVPPPPSRLQNRTDREFYVLIPAGKFQMGCVPGVKCEKEEEPRHEVTISKSFWMGENEVQVDSYQKFIEAHKSEKRKMPQGTIENKNWKDGALPINNMTWEDARDYCGWAGGRLPTEAEWEYAARGGQDKVYPFDDLKESRDKANFYGKQGNDIWDYMAPVKKFDANKFKLYDMSGNVWEIVSDFFGPYSASAVVDPKGLSDGKVHVKRGGSYDSDPNKHLRISYRDKFTRPWPNVGFRCVMDDTPETKKILRNP
jgi:sulfatase modifying factor 1